MTQRPPPPGVASKRGLGRGDLQLFFNAAGRVNRPSFIAGMAVTVLAMRLPVIFAEGFWRDLAAWIFWPTAVVAAGTLGSKRLHDLGLAGWWVAVPLALLWVCAEHPPGDDPVGSGMGGVLVAALALLAVLPGDPHFNRFGPAPA